MTVIMCDLNQKVRLNQRIEHTRIKVTPLLEHPCTRCSRVVKVGSVLFAAVMVTPCYAKMSSCPPAPTSREREIPSRQRLLLRKVNGKLQLPAIIALPPFWSIVIYLFHFSYMSLPWQCLYFKQLCSFHPGLNHRAWWPWKWPGPGP